MSRRDLVIEVLRSPERMRDLVPSEWDLLVRQARRADLLGRLAAMAQARGDFEHIPPGPRAQFDAACVLTRAQHLETRRELGHIAAALAPLALAPVLLKGAAYLASDGPAAVGRTFADIDILVPRERLPEVEAHLMMGGWVSTHHLPYDQRYYREWMHELPPMEHVDRASVLDVHHAILPLTARLKPSSQRLLETAMPCGPHWSMLAPVDMTLHSMVHLIYNEELSHGLRDLSDIDLMLRRFAQSPAFWGDLIRRAAELDLGRPLHYALQQAHRTLATPVPRQALDDAARAAPARHVDALMRAAWRVALRSPHSTSRPPGSTLADLLLFVRAHWLRMPAGLLLRHLVVKGLRRLGRDG